MHLVNRRTLSRPWRLRVNKANRSAGLVRGTAGCQYAKIPWVHRLEVGWFPKSLTAANEKAPWGNHQIGRQPLMIFSAAGG